MTPKQLNQQCSLVLPYLDSVARKIGRQFGVDQEEVYSYGLERLAYISSKWRPGSRSFLKYVWTWLTLQVWKKAKALKYQAEVARLSEIDVQTCATASPSNDLDEAGERVQRAWETIINALPVREGDVLAARYGVFAPAKKLVEIAEASGVSKQYIDQIRKKAEMRIKGWWKCGKYQDELETIFQYGLDH
jgi:RNA polymerase sigma factor (sigma-70 family)